MVKFKILNTKTNTYIRWSTIPYLYKARSKKELFIWNNGIPTHNAINLYNIVKKHKDNELYFQVIKFGKKTGRYQKASQEVIKELMDIRKKEIKELKKKSKKKSKKKI